MREDILEYKVKFFSNDGQNSDVLDYILELIDKNPDLARKSIHSIRNLPKKYFEFTDIKHFEVEGIKLYELRVRSKNDICRYFFVIDNPNFITLLGFTKKTQKIEQKQIKQAIKNYQEYTKSKLSILIDDILT
jgi:phage-related protein